MSIPELELAAAEAVFEVAREMIIAAGSAMQTHGNDPTSPAILSAAFVFAIDQITKTIDPTFRRRVLLQLQGEAQ